MLLHEEDVWQVSQLARVGMWLLGLPGEWMPSWHDWQLAPAVIVLCEKRTPENACVPWHESQVCLTDTGMWLLGMVALAREKREPVV